MKHVSDEKNFIEILKNAKLGEVRKSTLDNISDLETLKNTIDEIKIKERI